MELGELTLDVEQHIDVAAPIDKVFAGLLARLTDQNSTPDGTPMPMRLEAWPGGRWFRDLGGETGHLWGHVQVIKPPRLLEVTGPLFMSYPVAGHLQVRLEEAGGGTRITLRHRALGVIDAGHREGVQSGWSHLLDRVQEDCK